MPFTAPGVLIDVGDGTLIPLLPASTKPPISAAPVLTPNPAVTTPPPSIAVTPPLPPSKPASLDTDALVPAGVTVPAGYLGQSVTLLPAPANSQRPVIGATHNLSQPTAASPAPPQNVNTDALIPIGVHVPKGFLGQNVTLIPAPADSQPPMIGATQNSSQPAAASPAPPQNVDTDALIPIGVHVPKGFLGQNVTVIPALVAAPPEPVIAAPPNSLQTGGALNLAALRTDGHRTLQSALGGLKPIIVGPPSLGPLRPMLKRMTELVIQDVASDLGLRATTAEIAFSLQPSNIPRAIPSLVLAASLFRLEQIAAAPPYNHWGPHDDLTNGAPDAFLHAAYAGLLTLRYGEPYAETLTTLHETGTPQVDVLQRNARKMDLHNNGVGIKLALAIDASPPGPDVSLPSFGVARNRKEAELLSLLLYGSTPRSGLPSGLVTVGRPGATEAQVKHDPKIYSLNTGRPVQP